MHCRLKKLFLVQYPTIAFSQNGCSVTYASSTSKMSAAVSAMPPAAAVAPNAPSNGAANNVDIGCTAREVTSHYDRWAPYYDTCYNRVRDLVSLYGTLT